MIGMGATFSSPRDHTNVQETEIKGLDTKDACNINLTTIGELVKLMSLSTAGYCNSIVWHFFTHLQLWGSDVQVYFHSSFMFQIQWIIS